MQQILKRHKQLKSSGSFQHEVMPPEVLDVHESDLDSLRDHFTPERPVALVKKNRLTSQLLDRVEQHGMDLIRSGKGRCPVAESSDELIPQWPSYC